MRNTLHIQNRLRNLLFVLCHYVAIQSQAHSKTIKMINLNAYLQHETESAAIKRKKNHSKQENVRGALLARVVR